MPEQTLKILIDFFAYLLSLNKQYDLVMAKSFMDAFLSQFIHAGSVSEKTGYFEEVYTEFKSQPGTNTTNDPRGMVSRYCEEINKLVSVYQKVVILLYLFKLQKIFDFNSVSGSINSIFAEFPVVFNFPEDDLKDYRAFFEDCFHDISDKKNVLIISTGNVAGKTGMRYISAPGLKGQIFILKAKGIDSYLLKTSGDDNLQMGGRHLFPGLVYFMQRGASVRGPGIEHIHFNDIEKQFYTTGDNKKIHFKINQVTYQFNKNKTGVHRFSFEATSGQLVAVMGGSGTGKSTLLNLLNGVLKPSSGSVTVNNINLHENFNSIRGILGNIPQTDTLFEELTVGRNLYFSSRLVFDNVPGFALKRKIVAVLNEFGLFESKKLKVGNTLDKSISGGQMKRLNIALEIIRQPGVLFIDEPTSGLSSSDSLKIIQFLKKQTRKDRLIFVNIHQPSSDIYKYFDSLVILDSGGYPVYTGNPVEALPYFRKNLNLISAETGECPSCGSVNTEELFYLIEKKKLDSTGNETDERAVPPARWYELFQQQISCDKKDTTGEFTGIALPEHRLPPAWKQFMIYFKRNLILKITDKQYLAVCLTEAPLLAVILGFFMKQTDISGNVYHFSENENIPSYLFMSIIVSLFIGLIVSSEEIIRDRKILKKESYIGLSFRSYVHSKITYLFALSFIQMSLYVFIGNYILEISGMNFYYLAVLWSVSCFANLLGLLISANLKSVVAIYISIPFLLIPQILLAGVVVSFDKLHHSLAGQFYVPFTGDMMASRWGYEALAVAQFTENNYQRNFNRIDRQISETSWEINFKIPLLLEICNEGSDASKQAILKTELENYKSRGILKKIPVAGKQEFADMTKKELYYSENFLNLLLNYFNSISDSLNDRKDRMLNVLDRGQPHFVHDLKQKNYNRKLADFVLNNNEVNQCIIYQDRILRKFQPVFHVPGNSYGRSHFYAPVKKIGSLSIGTFHFNTAVIWLMSLLVYLLLINRVFSEPGILSKKIWTKITGMVKYKPVNTTLL